MITIQTYIVKVHGASKPKRGRFAFERWFLTFRVERPYDWRHAEAWSCRGQASGAVESVVLGSTAALESRLVVVGIRNRIVVPSAVVGLGTGLPVRIDRLNVVLPMCRTGNGGIDTISRFFERIRKSWVGTEFKSRTDDPPR